MIWLHCSDVTIIEIDTEITIFLGKMNRINISIFGASVTRFPYRVTLEGPAISAGGHRMGCTPPTSPITLSVEEFISP